MPLKLLRKPEAARRIHPVVLNEVRQAYAAMAKDDLGWLREPIAEWDEKPDFKVKISVGQGRWVYVINVDRRTTAGKKYTWADLGTGSRGGGSDYYIFPKKEGGTLRFEVPSWPKTVPTGPINQLPAGVYHVKGVKHPGIWPRNWTKQMFEMKSERARSTTDSPPGFRAVTEAAIKRAFRKMGIYS